MPNQSSRITTLLGCCILLLPFLSSSGVAAIEDCQSEGEQPLEFRFFTDNNSARDNGWTLECDYEESSKEMLWEVPIGSLKFEARTQIIREAACVPDTATCTLRLYDAAGDGLQGDDNSQATGYTGWFAFMHGATTVGTYENLDEPAFSELTYCVGPNCNQAPQEIQADDENCQDVVYLAMQLDNNPQDTTYQLICGNGVNKRIIWNGKDFTEAGAYVEEETCLPKNTCCEFIVYDGDTNGLTSPVDVNDPESPVSAGTRPMGFIYLERNFEPVLEYDGITGEEFDVLAKTFGCGANKNTIKDDVEVEVEEEEEDDLEEDNSNMETADVDVDDADEVEGADEEADQATDADTDEQTDEDANDEEDADETPNDADDNEETLEEIPDVDEDTDAAPEEVADEMMGDETPTEESGGFFDDDYQNGKFDDDFNNWQINDGLNDDVKWFYTDEPTVWPTDTAYPTSAPTAYPTKRDTWDLYDDVVEQDDIAWATEEMQNLEDLVLDADNASPGVPEDVAAIAFLNGNNVQKQQQQGMSKEAKIAVGVVVPLVILATIAIALFCFRESLMTRFGNNADDEVLEKDTHKPEAVSEQSYSEDDVRSEHSLEVDV